MRNTAESTAEHNPAAPPPNQRRAEARYRSSASAVRGRSSATGATRTAAFASPPPPPTQSGPGPSAFPEVFPEASDILLPRPRRSARGYPWPTGNISPQAPSRTVHVLVRTGPPTCMSAR